MNECEGSEGGVSVRGVRVRGVSEGQEVREEVMRMKPKGTMKEGREWGEGGRSEMWRY